MILPDTNVAIAVMSNKPPVVRHRLGEAARGGLRLYLSSIVLFELRYGVEKSQRRDENDARLKQFLQGPFEILPFDAADAEVAGRLCAELAAAGTPIGAYDTLIAGQARRHGATLVTANAREFERVSGLVIEDWTR